MVVWMAQVLMGGSQKSIKWQGEEIITRYCRKARDLCQIGQDKSLEKAGRGGY